jgi:hypothetical protein
MIGLEYGSEVQDWKAWLSEPRDEDSGLAEFWDGVEEPWRWGIPGAWIEDGEEGEDAGGGRRVTGVPKVSPDRIIGRTRQGGTT